MRQTLGIAVFSGMLGVTLFGIFLTPVFFYVIEWFSELWPFNTPEAKHAGTLALDVLTLGYVRRLARRCWRRAAEAARERRPGRPLAPRRPATRHSRPIAPRLAGDSRSESPDDGAGQTNGDGNGADGNGDERTSSDARPAAADVPGDAEVGGRHVLALLHRPADLRLGAVHRHHARRRHRPVHAADRAVPGDHAADGRGVGLLSRRQRPGRGRHRGRAHRAAGQRRREHDVHVLAMHQRRQLHADRHVQARRRPEHRPGAGAEPRFAGPADPAHPGAAPRHRRQQEIVQRADDRQPLLAGRHAATPST